MAMSSQLYPSRKTAADTFLYSDNDKSDSEWLVTPPGSPSRLETNQLDATDANPMTLKSRLENSNKEKSDNRSPKNQTTPLHNSSSVYGIRSSPSSSSSSRSTSIPSTPSRTSIPPAKTGTTTPISRAPISRATSKAARASITSSSTGSSRSLSRPSSSSGTSRVTLSTARETISRTPKTTVSATSTRSNNRPMSAPNPKQGSRSSTPTRRPSTPTGSLTVLRSKPTKPASKPSLSQGASPILRSRPWEPYEMPGFSLEAPTNLRTTLPDRPKTASCSRTRAFDVSRSASIERYVARRQSCSPSRSRAPAGNANGTVPPLSERRARKNNEDGSLISHVDKRNQKIERVVNTRNLCSTVADRKRV